MTEIYFPSVNKDTSHVGRYFRDTPASSASVLYQEFITAQQFGSEAISSVGGYLHSQLFDETNLTAEEYRASRYFREGLSVPEGGIKESVASALAEAHDRRFKRNLVLSRAKSGMGLSSARFGAGIVGSVLDPVNVGVAIMAPVAVGMYAPARAAAIRATSGITQRYGITAGRVSAGAGEAALGGVLFEAAVAYPGTRIQQDPEYGLFDAFLNVTVGSVLGGAVTGIGGKFSDVFRRANPETVHQAMQTATSQIVEGIPVRVDAVLDADPTISPSLRAETAIKRTQREVEALFVPRPKSNELPPLLKAINNKPQTLFGFIKKQGGIDPKSSGAAEIKQKLDTATFNVMRKNGQTVEAMAELAQQEGYFPGRVDTYDDKVSIDDLVDAIEAGRFSDIDPLATAKQEAEDLYEQVLEFGIDPKGLTDEELLDELTVRQGALTEAEALELERSQGPGVTREQLDVEIGITQDLYERGAGLVDYEGVQVEMQTLAKEFDKRVETEDSRITSIDKELALLQREVQAMRANDLLSEQELLDLREWDEVIRRADEIQPIAEAGAYCVLGR